MSLRTFLLPLFPLLILAGCGIGGSSDINLTYQESPVPEGSLPTSIGCSHHLAGANMFVYSDTGNRDTKEAARMNVEGPAHSTTLSKPAAGEHWVYVLDIRYCGVRPDCPTPTGGIALNGKTLTRQIDLDTGCKAFAYTVRSNGSVDP